MSPVPDSASALPTLSNEIPSTEMARFSGDVTSAGATGRSGINGNGLNGPVGSATAVGDVAASAAPMPIPTARMPNRPMLLAWLIGGPSPALLSGYDQPR